MEMHSHKLFFRVATEASMRSTTIRATYMIEQEFDKVMQDRDHSKNLKKCKKCESERAQSSSLSSSIYNTKVSIPVAVIQQSNSPLSALSPSQSSQPSAALV